MSRISLTIEFAFAESLPLNPAGNESFAMLPCSLQESLLKYRPYLHRDRPWGGHPSSYSHRYMGSQGRPELVLATQEAPGVATTLGARLG